jgi:hypothetical protein
MEDLNDLGNVGLTPVGCSLEQTAIYDDKKRSVAVNQEIWNALDETNKAALLLHEILYADYRRSGDTTSQNIRKIVAYLFSTAEKPSIKDELPSDHYICNSGNYSGDTNGSNFYLYFDGQGHTIIRFKKLMGRNTYMPIETMIPVVIDLSRLEQMSIDGKNTLVSRDQTVDFDEARSLEGGLFSGYNLRIRYQANEQFYLSFIDPTGIVLQHNPVISCYKPRQPL